MLTQEIKSPIKLNDKYIYQTYVQHWDKANYAKTKISMYEDVTCNIKMDNAALCNTTTNVGLFPDTLMEVNEGCGIKRISAWEKFDGKMRINAIKDKKKKSRDPKNFKPITSHETWKQLYSKR